MSKQNSNGDYLFQKGDRIVYIEDHWEKTNDPYEDAFTVVEAHEKEAFKDFPISQAINVWYVCAVNGQITTEFEQDI